MAYGKTTCWIKQGAVTDNLKKKITEAQELLFKIFEQYKLDLFVSSGMEGNHMCGSRHYQGLAIDVSLKYTPADLVDIIYMDICSALGGKGYDVLLHEGSHFHIEFDPKPGEPGYGSF